MHPWKNQYLLIPSEMNEKQNSLQKRNEEDIMSYILPVAQLWLTGILCHKAAYQNCFMKDILFTVYPCIFFLILIRERWPFLGSFVVPSLKNGEWVMV